jgi:hypothetical protein
MENKEVELRSFVDEQQYATLLEFFHAQARFLKEDNQVTYYFS